MKFNAVIHIKKVPTEVYRFVVSPTRMPEWTTGLKELKPVKGRRTQVGSVMNHVYIENDEVLVVREEVMAAQRPDKFMVELLHKNMISEMQYSFEEIDRTTRLTVKVRTRLIPAFMGIFGIFMKSAMQKRLQQDLEKLKKVIEKT